MSIIARKREIMASYTNPDADSNTDTPDYGGGVDTFEDGAPSAPLPRMVQISPVVIVEISISTRFGRRVEVIIQPYWLYFTYSYIGYILFHSPSILIDGIVLLCHFLLTNNNPNQTVFIRLL